MCVLLFTFISVKYKREQIKAQALLLIKTAGTFLLSLGCK